MIDIHTHILPAVDDGARNEAESLLMLRAAIREGIHTIVATPHYNRKHSLEKASILDKVENLKQLAKNDQLKIDILPGQEIRLYGDLLEDYQAGKILTLADNSNYMLIELPFKHVPQHTESLLHEIEAQGIKPVIVHPERNLEFLENPDKLYQLVAKGALTQLTTSSLIGYFGKNVQNFSRQLIERNWVHTIATDAHNTSDRPFNMSQAYEEIAKRYGVDYVSYFNGNARLMIEGKSVDVERAQPF